MSEPLSTGIAASSAPKYVGGIAGLAIIAVTIPALFWLGFGVIDGYAIGFTAFLVMLAAAVEYLPAIGDAAAAKQLLSAETAPVAPVRRRWFDALGVVWLLSIPLAPFLTWILRNGLDLDASNWTWILGVSTFFCVIVPLICVLPLLRYIRRGTAGVALTILAIGTGFPVATGAASAYDFVVGPQWQSVTVQRLLDVDYRTAQGTSMFIDAAYFELADGRRLSRSHDVSPRLGAARLLVLRGNRHIIDADPTTIE